MRSFQGRASEELYNQDLTKLYDTLKNIHSAREPENAIEGALWIDSDNNLKVKRDNKFEILYENIFQLMEKTIQGSQPKNPKPGQLWISDGVLLYYNGVKWESVKAAAIEDFSLDGFEPFLIIDTLEAACNEIIKKQFNIVEEEFIAGEGAVEFILQKNECKDHCAAVYVNGRILSKDKYLIHDSKTIRLIQPAKRGEYVLIQYLAKNSAGNNYIPLKFHQYLIEDVFTVETPYDDFVLRETPEYGKEHMLVYINGRYVNRRDFNFNHNTNSVTIKTVLEPKEEVIIQYICTSQHLENVGTENEIIPDIPFSQYLWPSSEYDKLFMDGKLHLDYETVNKTTIQYPSTKVQGKHISAVHVHPKSLCDIQKTVYMIDRKTRFIQVDEENTEFYALREGDYAQVEKVVKSDLYVKEDGTLGSNLNIRSFIALIYPNTEYHIKRTGQQATSVFRVSEYNKKPTKGMRALTPVYEVTENLDNAETGLTLTAHTDAQYLLIQIDDRGGEWDVPLVKTTSKTPETILLTKSDTSDSDYRTGVGGILLNNYIANKYDYILAVKYIFSETSGRGSLTKTDFEITDESQIIIGKISDPIVVFAQGHYLIEKNNYRYDKDSGLLTFLFPEQLDVNVLTFPKYEGGYILEQTDSGEGIVMLNKHMIKPLVFIYGEHVQKLADFEQDGNVLYVYDAQIDMSYAIVDCVDDYGHSLYIGEGQIQYDEKEQKCYIVTTEDFETQTPILFVNGLLINPRDVSYNRNKQRLYILNESEEGMNYTLLKDDNGRYLHSDIKQSNTYSIETRADQAMLYIDGNVVGDIEAFGALHLPERGFQREIKGIVKYDSRKGYIVEEWHMYVENGWILLDDETRQKHLNSVLNHYILENKTAHFTQIDAFRGKRCHAWTYKYDENIEYPLMYYGYPTTNSLQYEVLPAHGFPINQNALSVYLDGYRQYPQRINFPNGVKEISEHKFEIGTPVPNSRLDYVVEMPENGETLSCYCEILSSDDVYNQTLKTNVPLLPGFIDLFIDGIRQPITSYEVVDRHTLILHNFIKDPRFTNLILLEVRKDYVLKEATRFIERDGQTTFSCVDDMRSLLSTKDFVKIYINGVYIADDYELIREQGVINIPKIDKLGFAKKGHIVSFVWR